MNKSLPLPIADTFIFKVNYLYISEHIQQKIKQKFAKFSSTFYLKCKQEYNKLKF